MMIDNLTDVDCTNALPKDKQYKLTDGRGLYLLVKPNGSKLWRLKYKFLGKEKCLAIGLYPVISLKEARVQRDQAHSLLKNGINPIDQKRKLKLSLFKNTFQATAIEWHTINVHAWTPEHADYILQRLTKEVFPYIGDRSISEIGALEFFDAIKGNSNGIDHQSIVIQYCGEIFKYAATKKK